MFESLKGLVASVERFLGELGLESLAHSFGSNVHELSQAVVLGGVGFVGGFIGRKYFRFLFFVAVVLAIGVKFLELKGMITVDWQMLYRTFGGNIAGPMTSAQEWFDLFIDWMKDNVVPAVGLLSGLYFGLKAG